MESAGAAAEVKRAEQRHLAVSTETYLTFPAAAAAAASAAAASTLREAPSPW